MTPFHIHVSDCCVAVPRENYGPACIICTIYSNFQMQLSKLSPVLTNVYFLLTVSAFLSLDLLEIHGNCMKKIMTPVLSSKKLKVLKFL